MTMNEGPKRTVSDNDARLVVPGIAINSSGTATIDPSLQDTLFDLAFKLEDATGLPVDIEHVVAAVVFAERKGELESDSSLDAGSETLIAILSHYIPAVFAVYGSNHES